MRRAPETQIPFQTDGNSPTVWREGRMLFFTSDAHPVIAEGSDQFSLGPPKLIALDRNDLIPMWLEAVWLDGDGAIYGWYHNEPRNVCPGGKLTVPQIGAAVSYDGGASFRDLGLVLTSGDPFDCTAQNGFFAGGHGDFSVILDRDGKYFYFLFTNYGGDLKTQGVAMARLAFENRANPSGVVFKYFEGKWEEPGLRGRVTPFLPARERWQRSDTDSFWGPAIHWNTYLEKYVVLLNHACCEPGWPQAGINITFNSDLSDPSGWSEPELILRDIPYGPGYYPQVIGLDADETNTVAGRVARLYVHGASRWEIVFSRPEDLDDFRDPAKPSLPSNPETPIEEP